MSAIQKVSMCLCKLHLNLNFNGLSVLFGISPADECRKTFCETLQVLALIVKPLVRLPTRVGNHSSIPSHLKSSYGDACMILDVVRLPLSISESCLKCLSSVMSHYDGKPSFLKALLGVSPCGLISFVSKCFGELAPESTMFEESDLLERNMCDFARDAIMVSESLPVPTVCEQRGLKIFKPSPSHAGFSLEISNKKCHASTHVQRWFCRMAAWQVMKCLSWPCVSCCDDILTVVAGLSNLTSRDVPVAVRDCSC